MKNRQIDINKTKQVRISEDLHQELKLKATEAKTTIRAFLDKHLLEWLFKSKDL